MVEGKWISYLRVSTGRQGRSGLGLEAQRHAVMNSSTAASGRWSRNTLRLRAASGQRVQSLTRPSRRAGPMALSSIACLETRTFCSVLNRPASTSLRQTCRTPTVGIMAMVADDEGRRISLRTQEALAAAKRRGTRLGGDRGVTPSAKARKLAAEALRERAASRAADIAPIIADTGWRR